MSLCCLYQLLLTVDVYLFTRGQVIHCSVPGFCLSPTARANMQQEVGKSQNYSSAVVFLAKRNRQLLSFGPPCLELIGY